MMIAQTVRDIAMIFATIAGGAIAIVALARIAVLFGEWGAPVFFGGFFALSLLVALISHLILRSGQKHGEGK